MKKETLQPVKSVIIFISSLCFIWLCLRFYIFPASSPLPCDTSIPKEIKSLVYPGAKLVCWQGKILRLKYYIGDYLQYPKGGSGEGVSVEVLFKRAMYNHPYIIGIIGTYPYTKYTHYPDISFYHNLKSEDFKMSLPGYKVYKITSEIPNEINVAYKGSIFTEPKKHYCYTLDSNDVVIEVCAVEHEISLTTDPIKVVNYVTKALSSFNSNDLLLSNDK